MRGLMARWGVAGMCLAATVMAQPSGNCLLLTQNGNAQYVVVAHDTSLVFSNAFTIAAWGYPVNMGEWSGFISKAGAEDEFGDRNTASWTMQFSGLYSTGTSGQLLMNFAVAKDTNVAPNWCATSALTSGQWVHIALTYDGSALKIYLDGTLATTCNGYSGNLGGCNCSVFFGVDIPGTAEYFVGAYDDIAMWSTALSAADITTAKSGDFTGLTSGMVGLWRFEEGAGTIVGDTGPLAKNHGTIRGTPTWRGINPATPNTLQAPYPSSVKTPVAAASRRALSWTRSGADLVLRASGASAVRVLDLSGRCVYERHLTSASQVRIPAQQLGTGVLVSEITFASGEVASVPVVR